MNDGLTKGSCITLRGPGVNTTLRFEVPGCGCGPAPDSVIVVPRLGQQLLVVRNKGRGGWGFPGGKLLPGETPEAAARREVMEESGASLGELDVVCTYVVEKDGRLSHGMVYTGAVTDWGQRTDTGVIGDVALFPAAPRDVSFSDGFVELMFRMHLEAGP